MSGEGAVFRLGNEGRVAVLELDYPDRSVNVVDEALLDELKTRVDAVMADPDVDALVLASAKESFGAGADVAWLPELAAREDAEQFLASTHAFMTSLADGDKPLVSAVGGYAFGGALELALGGHGIVAAVGTRLGLPEVTLGLLPGGGGTQLLTRFVPLAAAADLLTSGRAVEALEAAELGLVDEVVAAEELRSRAVTLARELGAGRGRRTWRAVSADDVVAAKRTELAVSRGGLSRAAETVLDVLEAGCAGGPAVGLEAERRGFLELLSSAQARAAIHLFIVEQRVKSAATTGSLERVAVVGGGQMGAGIAATAATRGLRVTVRDVSEEALEQARNYLDTVLSRKDGGAGDQARERWSGTTAWDGFADADLVIEAVFEKPRLKLDVLDSLSGVARPDAVVATNTSAISVGRLATVVQAPERFLGMHFFSPVERMPLVELIPHSGTSPEAVERAAGAGRRLGKVGITVGDAPGFFTSRVYARWLVEGVRLVLDGVDPAAVDAAAKRIGFPAGPLQAHDQATLELVLQASIGQVAEKVMADRLDVAAVGGALQALVASGARGRRHGLGFYEYDATSGKRMGVNPKVNDLMEAGSADSQAAASAGNRLLLAFVTECLQCWDDGTLCHPDDGDLAAVLGIGFPRVLGGPFHWVDETGPAEVARMCTELGGKEFAVGVRLGQLADSGGRFADEQRRATPFDTPFTAPAR